MSTLYFNKRLIFLTLSFFWIWAASAQSNFNFRGKAMFYGKFFPDAKVTVYENNDSITQTKTNSTGFFRLVLKKDKKYLLEFHKNGYPLQRVLISTHIDKVKTNDKELSQVVFNFPLDKPSETKPNNKNETYITSFSINDDGSFKEKKISIDKQVINTQQNSNKISTEINNNKKELTNIKDSVADDKSEELEKKYRFALLKMDSMLYLANKKAKLILENANWRAEKIISEANKQFDYESKTINTEFNKPKKNELKEVGIDAEKFYSREDIKKYQETIAKLEKLKNNSKKNNIEYLDSKVKMNELMLKEAKKALSRMNAKTHEDSLILEKRRILIEQKENEIKAAKTQIDLQKAEIRNKNLMLMFAITGLLFFIVLFIVVFQNYRLKQKTNAQLEKQNQEIALKNKKIIDSITYAKTIQQAILPLSSKINKHFDSFIIFQPKDIVSGDFYWFTYFEDTNTTVFAVVDCTGHGVPGAFMSMIGNRLLVEIVNESKITDPKDILEKLDESLRKALMQDETLNNDGMDMCICTINRENNELVNVDFAGAKRPLFYKHNNKIEFIKGTVRGIGGRARLRKKGVKPFVSNSLKLKKGDTLYLTTDGFLDLQSPERKKFGRKNFIELLDNCKDKSMQEQQYIITKALDIHKGNEQQIDDITIMGIKI